MLRIAFVGAHSTGKTTLCDALSAELKIPKVVNMTRDVPKELRGTAVGQELILTNYLYKVARLEGDYVIDRTPVDNMAYSLANNLPWNPRMIDGVLKFYAKSSFFPTHIFYLPIEFDMVQDGERPDEELRKLVDVHIQRILGISLDGMYTTLNGSVEERLARIRHVLNLRR